MPATGKLDFSLKSFVLDTAATESASMEKACDGANQPLFLLVRRVVSAAVVVDDSNSSGVSMHRSPEMLAFPKSRVARVFNHEVDLELIAEKDPFFDVPKEPFPFGDSDAVTNHVARGDTVVGARHGNPHRRNKAPSNSVANDSDHTNVAEIVGGTCTDVEGNCHPHAGLDNCPSESTAT